MNDHRDDRVICHTGAGELPDEDPGWYFLDAGGGPVGPYATRREAALEAALYYAYREGGEAAVEALQAARRPTG